MLHMAKRFNAAPPSEEHGPRWKGTISWDSDMIYDWLQLSSQQRKPELYFSSLVLEASAFPSPSYITHFPTECGAQARELGAERGDDVTFLCGRFIVALLNFTAGERVLSFRPCSMLGSNRKGLPLFYGCLSLPLTFLQNTWILRTRNMLARD